MTAAKKTSLDYAIGDRGEGKSALCRALSAGSDRLIIWDPLFEHGGDGIVVRSAADLAAAVRTARAGAATIIYQPGADLAYDFSAFCIGACAWGHCTVLVEELASVSTTGRAPGWWGRALRESRHRHLHIIANTQRPQEADKTIWGLWTRVAIFYLPNARDREYVAAALGLPEKGAAIAALPPLHFLELQKRKEPRLRRLILPT